jgi:AMMECR1 domain-containing protein
MNELNKEQQKNLLNLARKTIADKLGVDTDIKLSSFKDDIFNEKCGSFVTLHIAGNLRGCIGYIEGDRKSVV